MYFLLLCKECRRAERGSSREDETNTHCAATYICTSIDAINPPLVPRPVLFALTFPPSLNDIYM